MKKGDKIVVTIKEVETNYDPSGFLYFAEQVVWEVQKETINTVVAKTWLEEDDGLELVKVLQKRDLLFETIKEAENSLVEFKSK